MIQEGIILVVSGRLNIPSLRSYISELTTTSHCLSGYKVQQGTVYKRSTSINEGDIRRGNNNDS